MRSNVGTTSVLRAGVAAAAIALAAPAGAQSFNLYGNPGLIDMPTAEMRPDADLSLTFGGTDGSLRTSINFQLLPRVSGTLRISTIDDDPNSPDRSDRGFDLRFQLLEEDGMLPAVALGFRDLLGEGPYGGEYLVATKTVVPGLRVTAGLGWGRLGGDNTLGAPFGDRPAVTDPAGRPQFDGYFRGDVGVFGGIAWDTPIDGLTVEAELSSDDYGPERGGGFERNSPLNVGLSYRPNEQVEVGAAYLYGSTLGVHLSFTGNPMRPLAPQDLGAAPSPVRARAADASRSTDWAANPQSQEKLVEALTEVLAADGISIVEARFTGTEAQLYLDNTSIQREPKAIGRVSRVLALALPASVETFRLTIVSAGLPVSTAVIRRSDIEAQVDRPDAGMKSWQTTRLENARASIAGDGVTVPPIDPRFTWGIGPRIPVNLLDADDGVRPDLLLEATASYQLTRGLSVSGEVSRFLIGESQIETSTSTSPLPRVRSDSDLYYSGRDIDLTRLTADWVFKPAPTVYGRVSAGVLERMFSGVSTEVLWAPVEQPIALGAEVNYVRQREFDSAFGLQDYDVVTGHASVYWDTGYRDVEVQFDAGRYLAGDWGGTLTLGRRFENGWDVRAFATLTDVSFEDFGEGSFAKGVSVKIPLRWGVPFETKSMAELDLVPVENDGGARLDVEGRLYERIRDLDRRSLRDGWNAFWQ